MTARTSTIVAWGLVVLAAAGCGAKGPPLPPLRPVPAAPAALTVSRMGDRVTIRVRVPDANTDPTVPLSISAVEIYARTMPMASLAPSLEQLVRQEYLVATVPVRPPVAPPKSGAVAAATAAPTAPSTAPDTRPGPGEMVVWSETIPTGLSAPLELTRAQKVSEQARRTPWLPIRPTGLMAPWFKMPLPTRYYTAVGISERRRPGTPSPITAVPYGTSPVAPPTPTLTYTETELTLTWTTSPPGALGAVVETSRDGAEKPVLVPVPPTATGSWSTPVQFGVERCFVVRTVVRRGAVSTESPSSPPACETPKDTFGPPAPTGLVPVSTPEAVTLVWEAVTAPDFAGYLVLRGTGASETLQQLTPAPITLLQYSDATARAGQRYVYYVVAVDALGNRGPRSIGVTVDRFTPAGR